MTEEMAQALSEEIFNATDMSKYYIEDIENILKKHTLIDAESIIKKLDDRISEFIKKQPDKKRSEPVVMMQELIQMVEREVEN